MKRTSIAGTKVGQLEGRVVEILVASDQPLTGREVYDALGEPKRAYTTIMTVLGRLVDKGLVERTDSAGANRFSINGGLDRLAAKKIDHLLAVSEDPRRVLTYFVGEIHDEALLKELAAIIERQREL
jgi:predicted transcriptional regulator